MDTKTAIDIVMEVGLNTCLYRQERIATGLALLAQYEQATDGHSQMSAFNIRKAISVDEKRFTMVKEAFACLADYAATDDNISVIGRTAATQINLICIEGIDD
jgi:hypothetical protein